MRNVTNEPRRVPILFHLIFSARSAARSSALLRAVVLPIFLTTLAACSLDRAPRSPIRVSLDIDRLAKSIENGSHPGKSAEKSAHAFKTAPASLSAFQCLTLRARAADISPKATPAKNCSSQAWGIFTQPKSNPAFASGSGSREIAFEIEVPQGTQRTLELIAYNPHDSAEGGSCDFRPELRIRDAYVIAASQPVDIFQSRAVELTASYLYTNPGADACEPYVFFKNGVSPPATMQALTASTEITRGFYCSANGDPVSFKLDDATLATESCGAGSASLSFSIPATVSVGAHSFTLSHAGVSKTFVTEAVTLANHAPTLTSVADLTGGTEDLAFAVTFAVFAAKVSASDPDGDTLKYKITGLPAAGNLSITLTDGTSKAVPTGHVFSPGETLKFTPALNANGLIEAFRFVATDGSLNSEMELSAKLQFAAENDLPVLTMSSNTLSTNEDTPLIITYENLIRSLGISVHDPDGDAVVLKINDQTVSTEVNAFFVKPGDSTWYSISGGTIIGTGYKLEFDPKLNVNGTKTVLSMRASDGHSDSDRQFIYLDIVPVADTPTITISGPESLAIKSSSSVRYVVTYANASSIDLTTDRITGTGQSGTTCANKSVESVSGNSNQRAVSFSNCTGNGTFGFSIAAGSATSVDGTQAPASAVSAPFTVDNTAPVLTLATLGVVNIANQVAYTISGTCSEIGKDVLVEAQQSGFTVQSNPIPTCEANGEFTATLNLDTLADGNQNINIIAKQTDAAGNVGTVSKPVSKDTVAPTFTVSGDNPIEFGSATPTTLTLSAVGGTFRTLAPGDVTLTYAGTVAGDPIPTGCSIARGGSTEAPTVTLSGCEGNGWLRVHFVAGIASDSAGNRSLVDAAGDYRVVNAVTANAGNDAIFEDDFNVGLKLATDLPIYWHSAVGSWISATEKAVPQSIANNLALLYVDAGQSQGISIEVKLAKIATGCQGIIYRLDTENLSRYEVTVCKAEITGVYSYYVKSVSPTGNTPVSTQIADATQTISDGAILKVVFPGSGAADPLAQIYIGTTKVMTAPVASNTYYGIFSNNLFAQFDDFKIAPLGSGGGNGGAATTAKKRVFVTSTSISATALKVSGSFTGGADMPCNTLATTAQLGGNWKAWIFDSTSTPYSRFTSHGPWYLVGSGEKISNESTATDSQARWENLSSSLLHPINKDETGAERSVYVWTGDPADSSAPGQPENCADWTSPSTTGMIGFSNSYDSYWTRYTADLCDPSRRSYHLYCFEQ